MNLIKDPWLPIVRKNGSKEKVAICQLLDDYKSNPIAEIEAPRPDFKNAIYQLLIGIVQVAAMPEDEEEWNKLFSSPYSADDFSKMILEYEDCFEIDSEGPAFMQDFMLEEAKDMSISKLFLDSPSDNALKLNTDHFVKRGFVEKLDVYWGAVALYALQSFTAGIGSGHRVGLRGGGPLSTIILIDSVNSLWKNIWINIFSSDSISDIPGDLLKKEKSDIFPWMKQTKSSKNNDGLFAEECHPFHHYFGMPTRLRMVFDENEDICDVIGKIVKPLIVKLQSNTHGNNYSGVWLHPLNAYRTSSDSKDKIPLSIKAQPGGIDYRHWSGLIVPNIDTIPSKNVSISQASFYRREIVRNNNTILWAAGYDTDKGKTRNWYESKIPVYPLAPEELQIISEFIAKIIEVAGNLSGSLRYAIKNAWFRTPKEVKGDMSFLDNSFWQNTEPQFYSILDRLIKNLDNDDVKNNLIDEWGRVLKNEAESLFDSNALAQQEDGLDMKRVVKARQELGSNIGKMINKLKELKEVDE